MAITLKGTAGSWGAATQAATPVAPTIPAHAVGDLLIAYFHSKPTATGTPPVFSTPAGWTKIAEGTNGSGAAQGADVGQTWTAVYYKIATSAAETISVTITNANSSAGKVDVFARTSAGYDWVTPTAVICGDTTSATTYALAGALTVGANDMIAGSGNLPGDLRTFGATWALAATGMTFGTVTKSGTDLGVTTGNDLRVSAFYGLITAGTQAAVTVTASNTLSGADTGTGVLVRLRETPHTVSTALGSYDYDGVDDIVSLAVPAANTPGSGSFSLGAWVKIEGNAEGAAGAFGRILTLDMADLKIMAMLHTNSPTNTAPYSLGIYMDNSAGTLPGYGRITTPQYGTGDGWVFVVGVFDSGTGGFTLYVGNETTAMSAVATQANTDGSATTFSGTRLTGAVTLRLGNSSATDRTFNGKIGPWFVVGTALTLVQAESIRTSYAARDDYGTIYVSSSQGDNPAYDDSGNLLGPLTVTGPVYSLADVPVALAAASRPVPYRQLRRQVPIHRASSY